jgi:hypothetical protein
MKRIILLLAMTLVMAVMMVLGGSASASIHPLVESFDCASDQPFEHHPLGDPAEVPGQTPGYSSHSDQSSFRALQEADQSAFSEHKFNGECGKVGQ